MHLGSVLESELGQKRRYGVLKAYVYAKSEKNLGFKIKGLCEG